jgi:GcrA cell cycle regulator
MIERGDAMVNDAQDRRASSDAQLGPGPQRCDWNEERVALLRRRWAEGASADCIARELGSGVSRCAVLGKIHRLKLVQPKFRRRQARKDEPRQRPPRPQPRSERAAMRAASQLLAAFRALGLDEIVGEPDTRSIHKHAGQAFGPICGLLDLTAATCRWPVGDPGESGFAFCGAAPFRRYPYCLRHCLIAYRPESLESKPPRAAAHEDSARGLERAA